MNHLFPYIERALLRPDVRINEQYEALDEITQLGMAGLTVAPFWVKKWRREMGDNHPASLSAVIGYPFGYGRTEVKQLELELALKDGASEVEVVLNTSALFSPTSVWLKIELVKLVAVAHAQEKPLTVILESSLLTDDRGDGPRNDGSLLARMIKTAADAGADFLKNATGSIPTPFSLEKALAFRQLVPSAVGVKIVADGATQAQMEELVGAGVERLTLRDRIGE